MPGSVAVQTQNGRYSIVQAALPGQGLVNLGVLLEDPQTNTLHVRFRRDMESIAGEEDDWFEALADDLNSKSREMGAAELLANLEETLSGSVLITDRQAVMRSEERR